MSSSSSSSTVIRSSSSSSSSSYTPWTITVKTTAPNTAFKVALSGLSINITCNWGDTSSYTYTTGGTKTHNFVSTGTYYVTISGALTGTGRVAFYTDPLINNTSTLITATTPITSVSGIARCNQMFMYSSLISVPSGLFDNCTLVTDFTSCFRSCTKLTSIPSGLFDNNTLVTNFSYCFRDCTSTSLTSIPSGLFDNNALVTSFKGCFKGCIKLTSIPSGLFDNNTLVTDFGDTTDGCFESCNQLTAIPSELFDNNTLVINFSNCFKGCTSLTSIPSGLFDNNVLVINFSNCFNGCTSLTGASGGLWWREPTPLGTNCYFNDASLSDYDAIPEDWGGPDYSTSSEESHSSKSSNSSSSLSSSSSSTEIRSSSSSSTSSSTSSSLSSSSSSSTSSSTSSSLSSSSSSTEIRSSSSSSSQSSFSTSSSSSTEIRSTSSSSSSSSSYLDYHDGRLIPFVFEIDNTTPIWSMTSYGEYVFAGTGPNGILLRSKDRFFWEEIYSVDDINIKSLCVQNDTLFIGTSPNGMIYIMDLITGEITLSQTLGNEIFGFIYYKNNMYAAGGIPNQIWVYNTAKNRWDSVYQPHSTVIYKMLIYQDKLYVISNSENIISFDGNVWLLESNKFDNVASVRSVSKEPFSHVSNSFINRSEAQTSTLSDIFDNEEIYDIYPMNYSLGLKGADVDGGSLVVGSETYSKIYTFLDGTFYPIFQTEASNTIHYLLNLNVGVNLASVDNKLYLIYAGDLPSLISTTTTPSTTTTTTTPSIVSLIYPSGGENLVVGTTITIQWGSTTSINDAVKIDLYKGSEIALVINPSTSNDGSYSWDIPASLIPGSDYKIVLTWLSVSSGQTVTTSSSGLFSIWYAPLPTTTTTTTTPVNTNLPSTSNCRGIPLIEFTNDEYITYMIKDVAKGGILFATSQGRIIGCRESVVNAYMTGDRNVYAEVRDGFGNTSDTAWTTFFYGLYNKIAEINEDKEIIKWKFEVQPSAILTDRITGVFLSPILSVKEDLNFWKQLIWKENKPANTEIIICIRSADSVAQLQALSWDYCFVSDDSDIAYGSNGFITRDLNIYQIKGKYLQFRVTMTTAAYNVSPSVVSLAITYSTQFATYFFTTKFALQNQSNVKSGLIIANMTEPQNTEIRFGIAGTNTADWNDYTVVDPNKLFSLGNLERMKVGIKMISYDDNYPEVAEFSLLTGSELDNNINEI